MGWANFNLLSSDMNTMPENLSNTGAIDVHNALIYLMQRSWTILEPESISHVLFVIMFVSHRVT